MRRGGERSPASVMVWGVFLMVLGGAFLLDRLGTVAMPNVGRLWPAVFVVIAAVHAVERRYGSALTFLLLCGWFFACEFGWYGFEFGNSWPLVLVAVGAGIVVRALGGEAPRHVREGGES